MYTELKKKIREFSEIAETCPENLQEKCFEVLLRDYLGALPPPEAQPGTGTEEDGGKKKSPEKTPPTQEDIVEKDIHVKARRFMKRHGIGLEEINQLFYKEGNQFLLLEEDLKTTKISESQVRIALLQALNRGLKTGEFAFDGEEVRQQCQIRKCYDLANFANHFKNSSELFDKFKRYDKKSPEVRLSAEGLEELAEVIRALQ